MRPIKFRAWNKVLQYMGHVSILAFHDDGTMRACEVIDDKPTFERKGKQEYGKLEDFELMQYTGLKDKNGKEIYEGDIVATHGECAAISWCDDPEHLGFAATVREHHGEREIEYWYNDCEVIGNIWENGDLLNESPELL